MEGMMPIQTTETTRHRRHHSRRHSNLSLGGMSFHSLNIDESEEPQVIGHNRKQSFHEIPHSLAWSMSDSVLLDDEDEDLEDDRDVRERLLSEGDVRRERLMTEDGYYSRQSSLRELDTKSASPIVPSMDLSNVFNRKRNIEKEVEDGLLRDSCFRGSAVSCPEMPNLDGLIEPSERVDLILRRARAFTEDSDEINRRRSSMDNSDQNISVRRYGRRDSMLIDSKFNALNSHESPTAVWVYWEENLESPASLSPFTQTEQF